MPFPYAVSITVKGMPVCTDPTEQSAGGGVGRRQWRVTPGDPNNPSQLV